MLQLIFGVFLVLHGLVHLLYFGQSARRFELRPDMTWPDGSWALSAMLGDGATRTLAAVLLGLIALCLVAGGIGIAFKQGWSSPLVLGAACSWQQGECSLDDFQKRFDWAFYRNHSDLFMKVIRRLEGVNELLRKSGFPEADNSLAWIQPFSKSGAAATGKLIVPPWLQRQKG